MAPSSKPLGTALPDAPRFPFRRECPFDPPSLYARARAAGPLFAVTLWNGRRAWLVTRHEEIRAVLTDDRRFSGAMADPDFPTVTEARVTVDRNERAFVGMDNPAHDRHRRMFTREFSVRRMLALKPQIATIAEGVIDELVARGPPADLAATLAVKFPSLVMSELIGSPYADHRFIIDCAVGRHGLTQTPAEALEKARALAAYFRRLIDAKEASPGDDLTSRVIESHVKPGLLSRDDFAEIGAMILRAGHDTTTNMIGMGMLLVLRDDGLRRRLAEHPDSVDGAVEELLRYVTPVQFSPRRVALEDVEIGGVTVRKGEGLFLLLASANRDERVFADPDRIDFGRDAAEHLTFGYGIHQCLGQTLARYELQVMYPALLRRLPALRLAAPLEEIRFKDDMQIYGVHNLPVAW
ncbi:MAG TPA: cytochrome P450 [Burkholderiales bacterium]|nr:cytochrome P450 [Burkholderiales bacterium]